MKSHKVFHYIGDNVNIKTTLLPAEPFLVALHDNVFVGAGAIIMYGVTIGENCIVAAGAVVAKDVPSGSVLAGVPAKVAGPFADSMEKADEFSNLFSGKVSENIVSELIKVRPIDFDIDKNDVNLLHCTLFWETSPKF